MSLAKATWGRARWPGLPPPQSPHHTPRQSGPQDSGLWSPREALTVQIAQGPFLSDRAQDSPAAGSPCPAPAHPQSRGQEPVSKPLASPWPAGRFLPSTSPQTPLGMAPASARGGRQPDQALSLESGRQIPSTCDLGEALSLLRVGPVPTQTGTSWGAPSTQWEVSARGRSWSVVNPPPLPAGTAWALHTGRARRAQAAAQGGRTAPSSLRPWSPRDLHSRTPVCADASGSQTARCPCGSLRLSQQGRQSWPRCIHGAWSLGAQGAGGRDRQEVRARPGA